MSLNIQPSIPPVQKNKPVILFINHWASRPGGAEYSLLDIMTTATTVFECHLITSEPGWVIEKAEKQQVICHIIPCSQTVAHLKRKGPTGSIFGAIAAVLNLIWFSFKVSKLVKRLHPVLIHANVPKSHVTLRILRFLGVSTPAIVHLREIFDTASLASLFYRRFFLMHNTRIIAISHAVKAALPNHHKDNCIVFHNGIRIPAETLRPPPVLYSRLLYLGRVVPWKRCETLIEALRVLRQHPDTAQTTLDIIGGTWYWSEQYRQSLQQRIQEAGLSEACHLLPHTSDPDAMYASHDIFCIASQDEPFGRVIAEAQAAGLPVVAFCEGGVAEIIVHNDTGFCIQPDDTNAFIDALGVLCRDPLKRAAMGDAGRKRMQHLFNRDTQIPAIVEYMKKQCRIEF
jgi:glycosyltransferase involved in cell wall biosynthesis